MTKVKICGLTRLEDARLALELGADELGFILAPSPRRVEPESLRRLLELLRGDGGLAALRAARGLPPFRAVGVFVNEGAAAMRDILAYAGLDAAQIHGDEDLAACAALDFPWYRALRPADPEEARALLGAPWPCPRLLVDAARPGAYGGTGASLSTELALAAKAAARGRGREFFLAGGLGPRNVARALREIGPEGLDLSSGVEEEPGRKSPELLRAFFGELRRAETELAAGAPAPGREGTASRPGPEAMVQTRADPEEAEHAAR